MHAAGAFIEMAAECGGTTQPNGQQHFDMLPKKPVAVSFDEVVSRGADDIGHLQRRPAHLLLVGWLAVQCERIQRTCRGAQMTLREMQVDGRFFQVSMAEQELNSAEIGASFEKVCGKAVPQQMRMHTFLKASTLGGLLTRVPNGFRIDRPIFARVAGKQPGAGFAVVVTPQVAECGE